MHSQFSMGGHTRTRVRAVLLTTLVTVLAGMRAHVADATPAVHRVQVTASRFLFSPGDITLKQGEPVELVMTSADVAHGLRIRELGVELRANKGQTAVASFTPRTAGDFVGKCSVFCGSGHNRMRLTVHVVPQ